MAILDRFGRPLRSLRVSVTDRCNLRCQYCMPEPDYAWLPRETLLSFEEMAAIADAFGALGVDRVRITGGEPLLRRDLPALVEMLAARPAIADLALTTNGVRLAPLAAPLRRAGLHRITVSLDTLHRRRFEALTRFDEHASVLAGIDAAAAAGFDSLKIDTVVIRGVNDDELVPLIEFAKTVNAEVRFIEYMDVGGATNWSWDAVLPRKEMLERLAAHYGAVEPIVEDTSAPADRYRLPDGAVFGIISSTTEPFCRQCDRSRLTADGMWYLCLYATRGIDLRAALRGGASVDELKGIITSGWQQRDDRGAETRLALGDRRAFVPLTTLKKNPHLEMHTRGG
jgi:cyclic pyranopterin phosphate synthase